MMRVVDGSVRGDNGAVWREHTLWCPDERSCASGILFVGGVMAMLDASWRPVLPNEDLPF